ncbi:hypothetical protein SLS62_005911 [Diatrype stigma]|uniref:F-box domain-containing protein n=1 Tax=Diatrype stigma TaxID=117547 RepID=A0AAN9URR5_9PEZI
MCQTPISMLPDELLLMIFELLIPRFLFNQSDGYAITIEKLCAVCRRFNRLATPLRYRTIIINPLQQARKKGLYRVDPSYRRFCRNIRLSIMESSLGPSMSKADWLIAADFFAGCTNVRCLEIRGGFEQYKQELWDFIGNLLKHMRGLQQISFAGHGRLLLPHLMRFIDAASLHDLQDLSVHGVVDRREGSAPVPHWNRNKASFTTLKVSNYEEDPAATIRLIRWSRELHHFQFASFYNYYYMDLKMFEGWLRDHKDSLQTIDIGCLSKSGIICDVSQFPKLTSLSLSRWSFSDELESPESDALCLLAPNLKRFTWDFSTWDQCGDPWNGIGEREERWLEGFVKVASLRSSPLEGINIIFRPDYWGTRKEDGYPWDRLERVKERCRPLGISLEYNTPGVSKEAWLKHTEDFEETYGRRSREGE